MSEHIDRAKGIFGLAVTGTGAAAQWAVAMETWIRIGSGIVAIAVGVMTFIYYYRKNKRENK